MRPRLIHVKGRKGLACLKLQGLILIPYPHQAPERMYSAVTEHKPRDTHLQAVGLSSSTGKSLNRTTQVPITTIEGFCERDLVASCDKKKK